MTNRHHHATALTFEGQRIEGRIVRWNHDKGFGFVEPNDGGADLFVHIKAFRERRHRPQTGERIRCTLSRDAHGRPCAADAEWLDASATKASSRSARNKSPADWTLTFALVFLLVLTTLVALSQIPITVLIVYLLISLITFAVYAKDKKAAIDGTWRVTESKLHLLALLGGWPGALIAQQRLRHKSSKTTFRIVFWVTVAINSTVLAWLMSPYGTPLARSLQSLLDQGLSALTGAPL